MGRLKTMVAALDGRDLVMVAGLALLGPGCWMAWEPLGLIAPGAVLTSIAVFGVRG